MRSKSVREFLLLVAACIGLCLIVPLTGTTGASAEDAMVKIDNFTFEPRVLTVRAGAKVTFENDDDIPHLVVANDGSFRSPALDTRESHTFVFTKTGDFPYFCGLHPHMQGTITVTP